MRLKQQNQAAAAAKEECDLMSSLIGRLNQSIGQSIHPSANHSSFQLFVHFVITQTTPFSAPNCDDDSSSMLR